MFSFFLLFYLLFLKGYLSLVILFTGKGKGKVPEAEYFTTSSLVKWLKSNEGREILLRSEMNKNGFDCQVT